MSRKASSTSEYYRIPRQGIRETVLQHKLEELFGSKATYIDAPSGDVSHVGSATA